MDEGEEGFAFVESQEQDAFGFPGSPRFQCGHQRSWKWKRGFRLDEAHQGGVNVAEQLKDFVLFCDLSEVWALLDHTKSWSVWFSPSISILSRSPRWENAKLCTSPPHTFVTELGLCIAHVAPGLVAPGLDTEPDQVVHSAVALPHAAAAARKSQTSRLSTRVPFGERTTAAPFAKLDIGSGVCQGSQDLVSRILEL